MNYDIILKSQQRFKIDAHNVYTEKINKIAHSSNHNKRFETFDRVTSYPCGAGFGIVYKTELLDKIFSIK